MINILKKILPVRFKIFFKKLKNLLVKDYLLLK